ncbi:helix-turn-helix transcriptional regulator [Flavobacterium zepuense]|uniref:Helix-turn-helix transcriptional regulator n=1 Tax=Flavobacterium zepuense TaxID=2593302 RepID=A0A552UZL2_9FLAO|nr:AraC family transcriptional regulator [Flavobacterium zepuense]TRW23632.1 helix-turn-helix transcriptional regulator [Flavobacterium zepuense]
MSVSVCAAPIDSLDTKDYKYLFSRIRQSKDNTVLQKVYLESFLKKAKAGQDWELLVTAYKNYVDCTDSELKIMYTDSMLIVANRSGSDKLIGSAYLSRGIVFYGLKRHEQALENYLAADPFIERSNDEYLKYKLKYNIAHEKYYLKKNEEAIQLFTSCLEYFKENNARAYLNTLHSLGLCYNSEGNYGKSEAMVALGYREANRLDNHDMDCYFLHLDGQNQYCKRNYALAIQNLKKSIPAIEGQNDYANVAVADFYIAKSYWAMKRYREAVPYLKRVAKVFDEREYIRPDLRENFELLIRFYKKENQPKEVLFYVDRLLKADSILISTHDHLYDTIHKHYDTRTLVQEKQNMEQLLANERSMKGVLKISLTVLSVVVALLLAWLINRRRQDRIFRKLLSENKKEAPKVVRGVPRELDIAPDTVTKIVRLLEKWEHNMKFLERDITLPALAVYLETNVRYVSDIILFYRHKKFSEYINDLKVDYIIEQLKTDRHKRLFTHDALAEEAGFSTTQRFVTAFKARTKLSPNYFSAKIRKELEEKEK